MKKIIFILFLIPFFAKAQSNSWQILQGKKIVLQGNAGEIKDFETTQKNLQKLKLYLKYANDSGSKKIERTIMLMDTKSVEVFRKVLKPKENGLSFNKMKLDSLTFSKPLVVYVISKPTNPELAAKVRLRPIPLVKLIPKN